MSLSSLCSHGRWRARISSVALTGQTIALVNCVSTPSALKGQLRTWSATCSKPVSLGQHVICCAVILTTPSVLSDVGGFNLGETKEETTSKFDPATSVIQRKFWLSNDSDKSTKPRHITQLQVSMTPALAQTAT